jgi:hypothetical protein
MPLSFRHWNGNGEGCARMRLAAHAHAATVALNDRLDD